MKTELNTDITNALDAVASREVRHVFLVACGGSLSIMHPGKYFLDRHSGALTSDVYNGDEFGTGGPANPANLYTAALLRTWFGGWDIRHLVEHEDFISEGTHHHGQSALIDLVARKPE